LIAGEVTPIESVPTAFYAAVAEAQPQGCSVAVDEKNIA
jgi:hypothetical protein